jgi:hypothetical protein
MTEIVMSDFLNSLCPLTRNKRTHHPAHKVAEGQENPEEASVVRMQAATAAA